MVRRKRCHECDTLFDPDLLCECEGDLYCESCLDKVSIVCDGCDTPMLRDSITECNGFMYCDRCYEQNTFECDFCGEQRHTDEIHSDGHGNEVCDSCYDNCTECCVCGIFLSSDDGYSRDGDVYCEYCLSDEDDEDEDEHLPGHGHMPSLKFLGDTILHNNIGIEFEIDDGNSRETCWHKLNDEIPDIWCKTDGSLSHGIEICTHPMSIEYFLNEFKLKEMIAICNRYGFKSDETDTCGMHIHIDRRWFGTDPDERENNITKMCFILDRFWDNFKTFTRRTDSSLSRWARRYGLETDDPWFVIDSAVLGKKVKTTSTNNRYQCLNLQNHSTVEWRMPKGSLNYNTIRATVQMVDVMVATSKLPIKDLHVLTWKKFIDRCMEMYP